MDHHLSKDLVEALRTLHGGTSVETFEDKRIQALAEQAFQFLDAVAYSRQRSIRQRAIELPRLAA
jgi:hypothetical protein